MIGFSCPNCAKNYNLKPEFAGRKTTCSGCKQPLEVPSAAQQTIAPKEKARIAFACVNCGMKFNCLAEYAGRSTKCPSCKQPLVVPSTDQTQAYVPSAGQLDGTQSSLAQAGVDAVVTLAVGGVAGQSALKDVLAGQVSGGARYVIDKELARGGMGAVLRAIDCDIRREVAVKYLLDQSNAKNKIRFVEEAQITGQLEHPNIVPIHELGVDAHKRIFFTMKMVKGRSLGQILKKLRDESVEAEKEYSLSRLLTIFVNVCNALAYAHARGVVHRDLKPANIMVGDFGEVYVMDWGLAKVLDKQSGVIEMSPPLAIPVARMADGSTVVPGSSPIATVAEDPTSRGYSSGSGKVVTSRERDMDLTQDGAVMGTPVYMPPEQATGQIDAIDERSDVYSMGAILYEMLTLQPPIDRTGGFLSILLRVSQGEISLPAIRAPERAAAGKIPPELSAIAMKALATQQENRYQGITALQFDIQRFQEGRSVSAKQDTAKEMIVKFVKRNKGLSAGLSLAMLVLLASMVVVLLAWRDTSVAYAAFEREQGEKERRTRESVPAFLKAANQAVERRQFDDALAQVSVALDYAPENSDALLLKGQILVSRKKLKDAAPLLSRYAQLKPDDLQGAKLANICASADANDPSVQATIGKILMLQSQPQLATAFLQSSKERFNHYHEQLRSAGWIGKWGGLEFDSNDQLFYHVNGGVDMPIDLLAFRGIPISIMRLRSQRISSLEPLRDAPLMSMSLENNPFIHDLSPLEAMPLTELKIYGCPLIKSLTPLKGLPLTSLEIRESPGIADYSPLRGLPLKKLNLGAHYVARLKLSDLTMLKGMPLEDLTVYSSNITDIEPLRGMALRRLDLRRNEIKDLSPLRGMPLQELIISTTAVTDLSPLQGMLLVTFDCVGTKVKDLRALRDMPLRNLRVSHLVLDLTPLEGMSLESFHVHGANLPKLKGIEVLRNMKSLQKFNGIDATEFWRRFDAREFKGKS